MGGPQARKRMKKVETGDRKVQELVKKIQMNDPKVGKVRKMTRFGREKVKKSAQGAGAGEEDEFIKCFDDITGKELPWQAVKEAREKEQKYLWQGTTPLQSTQSDATLTQHLRRSRWKSVHELLPESSKVVIGQMCMRELSR